MKANKIILRVTVEALSVGSLRGLLGKLWAEFEEGTTSGHLVANGGDTVEWGIERIPVEF